MDQSHFFPILWMNLLTHRHYTSPEGSSGAVGNAKRASASQRLSDHGDLRWGQREDLAGGDPPDRRILPAKAIDAVDRGEILARQHQCSRTGGGSVDSGVRPGG